MSAAVSVARTMDAVLHARLGSCGSRIAMAIRGYKANINAKTRSVV